MGVEWSSERTTVRPFGSFEIVYWSFGGRTAAWRCPGNAREDSERSRERGCIAPRALANPSGACHLVDYGIGSAAFRRVAHVAV